MSCYIYYRLPLTNLSSFVVLRIHVNFKHAVDILCKPYTSMFKVANYYEHLRPLGNNIIVSNIISRSQIAHGIFKHFGFDDYVQYVYI